MKTQNEIDEDFKKGCFVLVICFILAALALIVIASCSFTLTTSQELKIKPVHRDTINIKKNGQSNKIRHDMGHSGASR